MREVASRSRLQGNTYSRHRAPTGSAWHEDVDVDIMGGVTPVAREGVVEHRWTLVGDSSQGAREHRQTQEDKVQIGMNLGISEVLYQALEGKD